MRLAALNSLKYSVWISRGAGLALALDGGLILVPMLHNIIRIICPNLAWLFPVDENIWFHRQVAYSMAFWAMVHCSLCQLINVERSRKCLLPYKIPFSSTCLQRFERSCSSNPLYTGRRHHGSFYASYPAFNVLHSTRPNSSTSIRMNRRSCMNASSFKMVPSAKNLYRNVSHASGQ